MTDNLLVVLGVQDKEDVLSNLLCYCFNTHREFRDLFIKIFLKKDPISFSDIRAYTRISAKQAGIPDIVIAGILQNKIYICIIENKLKSGEGNDQTVRYFSKECLDGVLEFIQKADPKFNKELEKEIDYIFLTLFPDQHPQCKSFNSIYYTDINKKILLNICTTYNPKTNLASLLLCSLHELLEKFARYSRISFDDKLLQTLREEDSLDGTYLYFKKLLDKITFPFGLELEYTFRGSAQGRHYYGAVISKSAWHPNEMQLGKNKKYIFKNDCFSIHIEPQFDTLRGILSLYLHYETNPYLTKDEMNIGLTNESKTKYLEMRQAFIDFLNGKLKNSGEWEVAGGKNQVAKARLAVNENTTVNEFQETFTDLIKKVAPIIDDYIEKNS